jgi:hypothetical protein
MIKFEHTDVMNLDNAIRGMRNPLASWDKSDSRLSVINLDDVELGYEPIREYIIGEKDLALAKQLTSAGSDHRKFLRQIFVSVDITAPLYWWKEYDTYKVGTCANSCSTMHTIHKNPFELDDFSHERMTSYAYNHLVQTIKVLETLREAYNITGDRSYWDSIIQTLPSSFDQMRTCTLTYENVLAIYNARRNHKLTEWHAFCDWAIKLPYFEEFMGVE